MTPPWLLKSHLRKSHSISALIFRCTVGSGNGTLASPDTSPQTLQPGRIPTYFSQPATWLLSLTLKPELHPMTHSLTRSFKGHFKERQAQNNTIALFQSLYISEPVLK